MTEKEQNLAEYLFSEIGEIDERFLSEAFTYPQVKKFKKAQANKLRKILIAAVIGLAVLLFPIWKNLLNIQNDFYEPTYMSDAIVHASKMKQIKSISKDNIDLFDGSVKIIWKLKDKDDYFVIKVNDFDSSELLRESKNVTFNSVKVTDKNKYYPEMIWINDGRGVVFSPYLRYSKGNIGYGELFNYSPEVEPNHLYVNYVFELIKESVTEK